MRFGWRVSERGWGVREFEARIPTHEYVIGCTDLRREGGCDEPGDDAQRLAPVAGDRFHHLYPVANSEGGHVSVRGLTHARSSADRVVGPVNLFPSARSLLQWKAEAGVEDAAVATRVVREHGRDLVLFAHILGPCGRLDATGLCPLGPRAASPCAGGARRLTQGRRPGGSVSATRARCAR